MIFLFIALVLALVVIAVQNVLHYKEKREIFDKFMACDFKTYQYFSKEYPGIVKEKEASAAAKREERPTVAEMVAREKAKGF